MGAQQMIEPHHRDNGAIAASTVRFALQEGDHRGEAYTAKLEVCASPTCGCGVVWFEVDPLESDEGTGADSRGHYTFSLDLIERLIPDKQARGLAVHDRNFAQAVMRELDAGQWKTLRDHLFALKARVIERCDLDELEVPFPEHDIEVDRLMVGYHDVFPLGLQVVLRHESLVCVLFEQYCLRQSCTCTIAAVEIVAPGDGERAEHFATVMFDYRAGTWKVRAGDSRSAAATDDTLSGLLSSAPDLAATLSKRHRILRRLYARYRRTHALAAPAARGDVATVGRNDPRPCGSGRKYKHCCGR
jgi:hypothetical protein